MDNRRKQLRALKQNAALAHGYQSILIEPAIRSDEQKALFISGTTQRLELFEAQDDDLALIGTFTDTEMLGARLAGLL